MRIGVIGAGAIGGTVAALLDRGGHEVAVTARGPHLDAIRADGIRLTGGWGEHVALVAAGSDLEGAFDLVIITTKAQDAAAALRSQRSATRGRPLLVIQNGLDGAATASRESGASSVTAGLSMVAASFLSPGRVEVTTPGVTFLGGVDAAAIAGWIGDAVPVEVVDDIESALWTKLFVNQVNALPAITGLSVQEVAADPRLLRVLTESMRENVRVARANRIRYAPLAFFDDARLDAFLRAPFEIAEQLPREQAARLGDVPNPASTLQSIRRGRRTEIDHLNGAVVTRAGDVPVPVNAALVALVHEVEETGRFLTPEEVARRVRMP